MIKANDFIFSEEAINKNISRLTNQLWKLIPMRENNENWKKHLSYLIIEFAGLSELFSQVPQFLQIVSNLKGLQIENTEFNVYRAKVFEIINLLQEIKKDVNK